MPIGGIVDRRDRPGVGAEVGRRGRATAGSMPGRLTTTIVASSAIRVGLRQWGRSARLSAPIRKKSSSSGRSRRIASRVSTL